MRPQNDKDCRDGLRSHQRARCPKQHGKQTTRGVNECEPVKLRLVAPETTGRVRRSRTNEAVFDREMNELGITLQPD
jgi:hypothetical protein